MTNDIPGRTDQINSELIAVGADKFDMWLPETHRLATLLHPNEQVTGVVYGRYTKTGVDTKGRGALVATTLRVLLLDKKPIFEKCDEIGYGVISAVSYARAGIAGTIVLHTRMGDISVRTLNMVCAQHFMEAIESKIFKQTDFEK